ncbi:immune inhibitor A, partial [bacterium]|nr:immune inhibitor A [bacterium]
LSYIGSGGALPDSLLNIGNQWVKYNFSLENYSAGQTLQIRFRFKSDGSDVAEGFYLDDVVVTALVNSPVNDLTIRLDGDDAILSWTAPIGADSYQIYRSATPIFEPIGSPFATSTSTEWKDTNVLLEPGPYFYLVIAVRE